MASDRTKRIMQAVIRDNCILDAPTESNIVQWIDNIEDIPIIIEGQNSIYNEDVYDVNPVADACLQEQVDLQIENHDIHLPGEVVRMDTSNVIRDDNLYTKQGDTGAGTELDDNIDEDHNSDLDYQTESEQSNASFEQENQENNPEATNQNVEKPTSRKLVFSRKLARNSGKQYETKKGKIVKKRELKPLKECRLKCANRLPELFRKTVFDDYWGKSSYCFRVQFVTDCILQKSKNVTRRPHPEESKRKNRMFSYEFYLKVKGSMEKVCKSCFRNTLGESNSFIDECIKKKKQSESGIASADQRGLKSPPFKHTEETIETVKSHILSFPRYESHYTRRRTAKEYLPSYLNLAKMFSLYKSDPAFEQHRVSRTCYEKIFHQMNLAFKKPKSDTCSKCETFAMQLKVVEGEERETIEKLQKEHQAEADFAYDVKRKDVELAKNSEDHKTLIFDLQQCLPTPMLTADKSFYKLKLWTFNLTIHDFVKKHGIAHCYMWHEAISGRGGNQIASCVYRHLLELPGNVTSVSLFSDTCGGQNKNSHFATMLMYAINEKPSLKIIDHKFLIPGHTHMECDQDHSIIERQKTKTNFTVNHPYDWYRLVESCGQKTKFIVQKMELQHFLDFASLLKGNSLIMRKTSETNQKVNWRNIKWIRVVNDHKGILFYKESLSEEEDFKAINCKRKKKEGAFNFPPIKVCSENNVPINAKKKQNLVELCQLDLIDRTFHDFYMNLLTDARPAVDPDLAISDEEDD